MTKALKNHINCISEMLNAIQERKCCNRYVIIPCRNTIPFQELIEDHFGVELGIISGLGIILGSGSSRGLYSSHKAINSYRRKRQMYITTLSHKNTHDFSLKFQKQNITPSIASGVHERHKNIQCWGLACVFLFERRSFVFISSYLLINVGLLSFTSVIMTNSSEVTVKVPSVALMPRVTTLVFSRSRSPTTVIFPDAASMENFPAFSLGNNE